MQKKMITSILLLCLIVICCGTENAMAANTRIPILMYHNITEGTATDSMTITRERFRQDMQYLSQQGYTALTPADLINIRAGTVKMPLKPVMITFDDGYESNYTLAFPILKEMGVKATISLITSDVRDGQGNGLDWFMTWDQAKEMYQSGMITFGSHTHNLHNPQNGGLLIKKGINGIQRLRGETWHQYQQRVGKDISTSVNMIESYIPGAKVQYFSYPFGETDDWFGQILLDNHIYVSTITKTLTADIRKGLYGLSRYRMTMSLSASQLLSSRAVVTPCNTEVTVADASVVLPGYEIRGEAYVRLRDLAKLAQGTAEQFSVGWDNHTATVLLHSGEAYEEVGTEGQALPAQKQIAQSLDTPILVNGEQAMIAAYQVGSTTFVKPQALLQFLNHTTNIFA